MSGTSFEPLRTSVYGQGDNGSAWRVSVKIDVYKRQVLKSEMFDKPLSPSHDGRRPAAFGPWALALRQVKAKA